MKADGLKKDFMLTFKDETRRYQEMLWAEPPPMLHAHHQNFYPWRLTPRDPAVSRKMLTNVILDVHFNIFSI